MDAKHHPSFRDGIIAPDGKVVQCSLATQPRHLDLSDVVPHTLKYTAITLALQRGATICDVAGMFSTSVETVQLVYGHHSPDWQKSAVDAMNPKR